MKKGFLLLAIISTVIIAQAQIIALHSTDETQIFKGATALNMAYLAAQNGDTLYLSGGSFTPPANFDKQLVVIGAGHYADSTLATEKTFINGTVTLNENADNFYLEGVEVTGNFTLQNDKAVNYVSVVRCKINGTFNVLGSNNPSQNLFIMGSVIVGTINLRNAQNVLVSNSILQKNLDVSQGNVFKNNVFLRDLYFLLTSSTNTFENNIFLNNYPYENCVYNSDGLIWKNNLFLRSDPDYGANPTVIGNYVGIPQANIFVNQTGYGFNYAHNYHLQSPTTYLGTDGTQVGIYGGSFPYKEGAVPHNPHIQVKNIAPTTDVNGDLQIEIQVGAQDN